jgi:hypothetical protein
MSSPTEEWPVHSDYFAQLFLFCEVPDSGGAIHFPESGVHIYPKQGDAMLVTYTRTPAWQGLNENLSNEHIDCPVMNGTKTILQHQLSLYPKASDT